MLKENNLNHLLLNAINSLTSEDQIKLANLLKKVNILNDIVDEHEQENNNVNRYKKKETKLDQSFQTS